jgi:hypothetical protein
MNEESPNMNVDLSRKNRRELTRMVRQSGILCDPAMEGDPLLVWVVGHLVGKTNHDGLTTFTEDDIHSAMNRPEIVHCASSIIDKARGAGHV